MESPPGCNKMHLAQFLAQRGTVGYGSIHHKSGCVLCAPAGRGKVWRSSAALLIPQRLHVGFHEAATSPFHLGVSPQSSESSWASRLCIIWLLVLKATSCYVWLLGGEMLSWASAIIYPQSSRSCHVLLTVSCSTLSARL